MNETKQKYEALKKELGLTNKDIARMFGYSSAGSLRSASRYEHVINGVVEIANKCKGEDKGELKLVFSYGEEFLLPDISYSEFEQSDMFVSGSSDVEYDKYLRSKGMRDIMDFSNDSLMDAVIVLETKKRVVVDKEDYISNNK